jgi:hypothetical protein
MAYAGTLASYRGLSAATCTGSGLPWAKNGEILPSMLFSARARCKLLALQVFWITKPPYIAQQGMRFYTGGLLVRRHYTLLGHHTGRKGPLNVRRACYLFCAARVVERSGSPAGHVCSVRDTGAARSWSWRAAIAVPKSISFQWVTRWAVWRGRSATSGLVQSAPRMPARSVAAMMLPGFTSLCAQPR